MHSLEYLTAQSIQALKLAGEHSFDTQKPNGHWCSELRMNATFTAEYVFLHQALDLDFGGDKDTIKQWLLSQQQEDGTWNIAPGSPGDLSTTIEAYLALKILGVQLDNVGLVKARDFILGAGGIPRARIFTRFFLATFGLFPWDSVPQLPLELMAMPTWAPINVYKLSSWARTTLIPLLVVRHHQPIYNLPNGRSSQNDFLDELWRDPSIKAAPYGKSLASLLWELDAVAFGFVAVDTVVSWLGGLRWSPYRRYHRQACVNWILEHQEKEGDWTGYWPPMHGNIMALLLEGFDLEHPVVQKGLTAMERFKWNDERGVRIQGSVSPVWDTALTVMALCDAGQNLHDPRVTQAINWLSDREITGPEGDWRIYSGSQVAGGWSFQYFNRWYPDIDDTATVIMAMAKHDNQSLWQPCVSRAISWLLGMQNNDGGWAAFDRNNDHLFLNKIPFADMDSLCDPSTPDMTGRVIECFGFLLHHSHQHLINKDLRSRMEGALAGAVSWLLRNQAESGAWWSRWHVNYINGTSVALSGLYYFRDHSPAVESAINRAVKWLKSVQCAKGGWGEGIETYENPSLAGIGKQTPTQTAWALIGLLPYLSPVDSTVRAGVAWLVSEQTESGANGATWPDIEYTGTGFPKCLYEGYSIYAHVFPMMALGKFVDKIREMKPKSTS
ncbi:MAG: hypothetical protein Q9227_006758 [Pyrenula ochraceoflavens]